MSTTVKWGLITGMVYVIFSLISNVMGNQEGSGNLAISILIFIVQWGATFGTIFFGLKEVRDQDQNGFMNLGEALRKGMGISIIASLILVIFTLLYTTLIDTDMAEKMLMKAEEEWDRKNISENDRVLGRQIIDMMTNPWIILPFTILWISLGGMIKSLISGAILQKLAPPTVPVS